MVKESEHMEDTSESIQSDEHQFVPRVPVLEARNLYHIYGSNQEDGNVVALRGLSVSIGEGEVVAVGPGSKNESGKVAPMDVKVGDIVLFGKWSGTEVKIDGKEYSIMKESDIMGISKSKK